MKITLDEWTDLGKPVYFCATAVYNPKTGDCSAELVHCTKPNFVYLSRTSNGLSSVRTLYNIFRYVPDEKLGIFVPDVRRTGNLFGDIHLRPDQIDAIEDSILNNRFFDE